MIPLIFNCNEYQGREANFVKIISNKDKELDDYRSQGVKLNRSNFLISKKKLLTSNVND